MLREHLSQAHDAASRRLPTIDSHVAWIAAELLGGKRSSILDLGCGPGLYANRLAAAGHRCTGIDFSPASIAYARETALPGATFMEGDLRCADFGAGHDLVMLIYGEFNVFRPADAEAILRRAAGALRPGGRLLLEGSTGPAVRAMGEAGRDWYAQAAGLWSDGPYLCLEESFWDEEARAATVRHQIIDGLTGEVTTYAASYQAYTDAEYTALLQRCGFTEITLLDGLGGAASQPGMMAISARTGL